MYYGWLAAGPLSLPLMRGTDALLKLPIAPWPRCCLRRAALALLACVLVAGLAQASSPKVLRITETTDGDGFDPATYQSTVSGTLVSSIFDSLYRFAYLQHGYIPVPNAAAGPPEVSDDGLTWTIPIRRGIHFADDPAFGGKRRELTAQDFVYSLKRLADPRLIAYGYQQLQGRIVGLDDLRARAASSGRFDIDQPVEGLRALDRYRLQIRLTKPTPTLPGLLATCQISCAVAREVVERYGDQIRAHPVGSGPFRLARWVRGARVVLERNPDFREAWYDEEPAPDDLQAVAIARRLRGLRRPLVDRVDIRVIEESQPRWLSFLAGEIDLLPNVPQDFVHLAVDGDGRLAPHLAAQGIELQRLLDPTIRYTYFNLKHPMVGGMAPEQIALRRAVVLGFNVDAEIAVLQRGNGTLQHSLVAPGINGFDPGFVSPVTAYNPASARALLDVYGYVDRDDDGYREKPDGSPLILEFWSTPGGASRERDELWRRSMDSIGIRIEFRKLIFAELIKAVNAGVAMMASFGWTGASRDAMDYAMLLYGPNAGSTNDSRFDLPAYNRLFDQASRLPHGAERDRVLRELDRLVAAYAPLRLHSTPISSSLAHPWVIGYRKKSVLHWLDLVDIQR